MSVDVKALKETYMTKHLAILSEHNSDFNSLIKRVRQMRNRFTHPSKGDGCIDEEKSSDVDNISNNLDRFMIEQREMIKDLSDIVDDLETIF